jgi:predicted ATP-binding protein involved in virulence
MTRFRLRELHVENYRCFETLRLALEQDTTVLFAENGGGKTALLTAMAMGLAAFQPGAPKSLKPDSRRDPRMVTHDDKSHEPAGTCKFTWTAAVGETETAEWSTTMHSGAGRITNQHQQILEAIERVRVPGERWPLFAWYGVDRMRRGGLVLQGDDLELAWAAKELVDGIRRGDVTFRPDDLEMARAVETLEERVERVNWTGRPRGRTRDRWDAYTSALDPSLDDTPLLQWLQDEMIGDAARRQQGQPERFFDKAVMEAAAQATEGVTNAWYDPVEQSPMVRFDSGHVAPWWELSDGYHVFIALVTDIARRAVILNEIDGAEAPARVEGVVLIDEIDLHLHPRWQRVALRGLREAFPRLQFVISTHSPQVLSSAENRQVRRLFDGKLQEHDVFVHGRDSNAILRELMHTDDRDEEGTRSLRELYAAIDRGDRAESERLYATLLARWGDRDPELIRAKGMIDEERQE